MFTALRTYRCTQTTATGYIFTPYEIMIGRNPRIHVPYSREKLLPKWPKYQNVKNAHVKSKAAKEYFYNRRHAAKDLPPLLPGDKIRIKLDHETCSTKEGTIVTGNQEHRSYIIREIIEGTQYTCRRYVLPLQGQRLTKFHLSDN